MAKIVTIDGEKVEVADAADGLIVGPNANLNALLSRRASRCEVGGLPVFSPLDVPESSSFGSLVATSLGSLETAADQYQQQRQASQRKLFSLVAVVSLFVMLMLTAATIAFFKTPPVVNPTQQRLLSYQQNEGTAAERLAERNRSRNRKELAAIRDDAAFATLSAESQQFVHDRLREFDAYTEYAKRFDPPTLSPREVRTRAELSELQRQLVGELVPPPMYAVQWQETAAVKRFESWKDETSQIALASSTWVLWYNDRNGKAVEVLHAPERSPEWRDSIDRFFQDANTPPWSLLGNRNESQRELQVISQSMDSVEQARGNWERSRVRLMSQRDLYDRMIDFGHWLNRGIFYPRRY
ncbi:hypothetical protein BH11PLA2_BH11PLA2_07950 [soil metagenome]